MTSTVPPVVFGLQHLHVLENDLTDPYKTEHPEIERTLFIKLGDRDLDLQGTDLKPERYFLVRFIVVGASYTTHAAETDQHASRVSEPVLAITAGDWAYAKLVNDLIELCNGGQPASLTDAGWNLYFPGDPRTVKPPTENPEEVAAVLEREGFTVINPAANAAAELDEKLGDDES